MNRILASLATLSLLFTIVPTAEAARDFVRNQQPAIGRRGLKDTTVSSYRGRHNRLFVQSRFDSIVRRMMPSLLTVTGSSSAADTMKISRLGRRGIKELSDFAGHCAENSKKCE